MGNTRNYPAEPVRLHCDHDFTVSANADEIVRICRKYGLEYDDQYAFLDYIIVH